MKVPAKTIKLAASHKQITDWVNNLIFVQHMGYPSYNAQLILSFLKPDSNLLKSTIRELINRHQLLRTSLIFVEGKLNQFIYPEDSIDIQIPYISLSTLSSDTGQFEQLLKKEMNHRFNYEVPCWFRLLLVKKTEEQYRLVITLDHLLFDYSFLNQFEQELIRTYQLKMRNQNLAQKKAGQYCEFSEYEFEWWDSTEGQKCKEFWDEFTSSKKVDYEITHHFSQKKMRRREKSYSDTIAKDLSTEIPGISRSVIELAKGHILTIQPCDSAGYQVSLGATESVELRKIAVKYQTSFYKLIQTAIAVLMARKTAKNTIYLVGVTSLRSKNKFHDTAGCLTRLLLYKVSIIKGKTWHEIIELADKQLMKSEQNAQYPFEKVISDKDIPYGSLGIVMINYIFSNQFQEPYETTHRDFGFATFPVSLEISGAFNCTNIICNYQKNWFSKEIIETLMQEMVSILKELPHNLDQQW